MDDESRSLLDDLDEGLSIVEVDWRPYMDDVRTAVGTYLGLHKSNFGTWYLRIRWRFPIRMDDIVAVRQLKPTEAV